MGWGCFSLRGFSGFVLQVFGFIQGFLRLGFQVWREFAA